VLFSPFTVREVRLRGLLATGRTAQAADLAGRYPAGRGPPSPHWRVIERITTAEVLARAGDERTAETMLTAAISVRGPGLDARLGHVVRDRLPALERGRLARLHRRPGPGADRRPA
jgi:hypothetical protein